MIGGRLTILSLLLSLFVCNASRFLVPTWTVRRPGKSAARSIDWNPFDNDDEDDDETLSAKVVPGLASVLTSLYGVVLLMFPRECPGQIHFLTMMRSTGFHKLEAAVKEMKKNIRAAVRSALWHAPSFLMAARSVEQARERIKEERRLLHQSRLARQDGVITAREARRIRRMRKNQIRTLQRDMKRIVRAGTSLKTVIGVLDIHEIKDILKGFMFQLTTVLATGHQDTTIGKFIARYCLSVNLGSMFWDLDSKLKYPFATLLRGHADEKKIGAIRNLAKVFMFGTSGYVGFFQNQKARWCNGALLGSSIIFRGIRSLADTFWDKKDEETDLSAAVSGLLDSKFGGAIMGAFTVMGLCFRELSLTGKLVPPGWLLVPIRVAEQAIQHLATLANNIG